jgi:hypothetical protein
MFPGQKKVLLRENKVAGKIITAGNVRQNKVMESSARMKDVSNRPLVFLVSKNLESFGNV